jgi:hypothetical protein
VRWRGEPFAQDLDLGRLRIHHWRSVMNIFGYVLRRLLQWPDVALRVLVRERQLAICGYALIELHAPEQAVSAMRRISLIR